MNCSEVQSRLSEYHDNFLDAKTIETITDHLLACSRCRTEADDLAQTMQLVKVLPEVEPPASFTTRVMAHVREQAAKPSAWERLFLPFRVKFPIHAAAVILVSILAVYVYQKEPQQQALKIAESELLRKDQDERDDPSTGLRARIPAKESLESARQNEATSAPVIEQAPEYAPKRRSGEDKKKDITTPQPALSIPAGSADQVRQQSSPPAAAPLTPREEKSAPSGDIVTSKNVPPPVKEAEGQVGGAAAPSERTAKSTRDVETLIPGATAKKEFSKTPQSASISEEATDRLTAPQRVLAPKSESAKQSAADYELVLRLRPDTGEKAGLGDRLESREAQTEAATSLFREHKSALDQARRRANQTGQPQAIWLSIPRTQLEQFKRDLAAIAQIESASAADTQEKDEVSKSSDPLRVKITVLLPLSEPFPPRQR